MSVSLLQVDEMLKHLHSVAERTSGSVLLAGLMQITSTKGLVKTCFVLLRSVVAKLR